MNAISLFIMWFLVGIQVVKSLDFRLDFGTQLRMTTQINEAKTKTISSLQQVFIYYADNSIARYSNTLTLLSSFSIQALSSLTVNVVLDTFDIYNGSIPCYYGIISGKREILVIQMDNTSKVKKIQGFDQLKHVEILSVSASGELELLIFDNNKIWKQIAGVKGNITSIPDTMSQTNTILKVLPVQKNGTKYYAIITVFSQIYYLNVSLQNSTYQISSLKLLRKLGQIIMASQIDRGENLWIQFMDGSLLSFSFFTNITKTIDVNISSNITTEVMKKFQPQILVDGERILLFDSKAIKINLILNSYTFNSDIQSFDMTNWTGIVALNSSSSFVYTKGSDIIYGLLSSLTQINCLSLCGLSDLCVVGNCLICSGNGSTCSECESGFALLDQVCYPLRSCDEIPNCKVCHFFTNYSCFECEANYTLNPVTGSCDYSYLPPPTPTGPSNQMNSPNQTISTNQTNTSNITSNNSITSNSTNSQTFNQRQLLQKAIPEDLPSVFQKFLQHFATAASKVNSFPGSRVILSFLAPFFGFLDDYWYYLYHEDQYEQLKYMPSFLAYMFIISKDRILMDQLIFSYPQIVSSEDLFKTNFTNFTPRTIIQIDEQETLLLKNFTDFYQQIVLTLVGFAILKLITTGIKIYFRTLSQNFSKRINKKVSDKNARKSSDNEEEKESFKLQRSQPSIFIKIVHSIDKSLTSKTLLLSLIGQNLIFLSFTFNSQLKIFCSFLFSDKANLVVSVIVGFVMLAFTGTIFLPAQKKCQRYSINDKIKKNIQAEQKEQKSELMFLTYFFHTKCILYGFIHGYLIKQPKSQYVLLIVVKLLMISLILSKKSVFQKTSQRVCMTVYFFAGIIIDSLCFMSKNRLIPSNFWDKVIGRFTIIDTIEIVSLVLIGLSILFDIILNIVDLIKDTFCAKKRQETVNASEILTGSNDQVQKITKNFVENILTHDKNMPTKRNPSHILLSKPIFRKKISFLKENIGIFTKENTDMSQLKLNQYTQRDSNISNGGSAALRFSLRNQLNIQMKKYNQPKNIRVSKFKDTFQICYSRRVGQVEEILQQQSAKQSQINFT